MVKKLVIVAVVGLVGLYAVGSTKVGSHFKAWAARVNTSLEDRVTPEAELARIKHEVGQLDGDIDHVKGDLAEANVNARLLRREVDEVRSQIKENDALLRKHGEVIKAASEGDQIQWGVRAVSYISAKELLMSEVKRYNDLKARGKIREQALATQEQTRDLVEQQLNEMLRQKDELASAVSEMEAEIKLAGVEQIRSKYQNDGTRMGEIKTSLADLRKRLMIQREKLQMTETYTRSPAADKSVDEILAGTNGPAPTHNEVKIIGRDK